MTNTEKTSELPPPSRPQNPAQSETPDLGVGESAWRSQVLRQAKRLEAELDTLTEEGLSVEDRRIAVQVRERIREARAVAADSKLRTSPWRAFRDWWTGNAVETAWDDLQAARGEMMLIQPSEEVEAQIPALQRRLARWSPDPAHDPQIAAIRAIADSKSALTREERAQLAASHAHVTAIQNDHTPARQFRNNLLLWTAGLGVGALALAGIANHGFRYVLIGAVAGLLTTAVAWRSLTHLTGPYSVNTAQAVLKVSAGAASALLGVVLLRSGIISGIKVTSSTAYGYAVIFGFSQQAFTQAVDSAAKKLGGSTGS